MTMRVKITNEEPSGREIIVDLEERNADQITFQRRDRRQLKRDESTVLYIHAASQIVIREDPHATLPAE